MPSDLRSRLFYKVITRVPSSVDNAGVNVKGRPPWYTPRIQTAQMSNSLWRGQDAFLLLQAGTSTHARGACARCDVSAEGAHLPGALMST